MSNVICRNDAPQFSTAGDPLMIVDPLDQQICELVAWVLARHYPGYNWLVQADRKVGFVDIRNVSLDGAMGCRIPLGGYATASELELLAMRYGGEILERYHVTRGAMDQDQIDALPTDFAGRLRADQ